MACKWKMRSFQKELHQDRRWRVIPMRADSSSLWSVRNPDERLSEPFPLLRAHGADHADTGYGYFAESFRAARR